MNASSQTWPSPGRHSHLDVDDGLQSSDQSPRHPVLPYFPQGNEPARLEVSHHVHGRVEIGIMYSPAAPAPASPGTATAQSHQATASGVHATNAVADAVAFAMSQGVIPHEVGEAASWQGQGQSAPSAEPEQAPGSSVVDEHGIARYTVVASHPTAQETAGSSTQHGTDPAAADSADGNPRILDFRAQMEAVTWQPSLSYVDVDVEVHQQPVSPTDGSIQGDDDDQGHPADIVGTQPVPDMLQTQLDMPAASATITVAMQQELQPDAPQAADASATSSQIISGSSSIDREGLSRSSTRSRRRWVQEQGAEGAVETVSNTSEAGWQDLATAPDAAEAQPEPQPEPIGGDFTTNAQSANVTSSRCRQLNGDHNQHQPATVDDALANIRDVGSRVQDLLDSISRQASSKHTSTSTSRSVSRSISRVGSPKSGETISASGTNAKQAATAAETADPEHSPSDALENVTTDTAIIPPKDTQQVATSSLEASNSMAWGESSMEQQETETPGEAVALMQAVQDGLFTQLSNSADRAEQGDVALSAADQPPADSHACMQQSEQVPWQPEAVSGVPAGVQYSAAGVASTGNQCSRPPSPLRHVQSRLSRSSSTELLPHDAQSLAAYNIHRRCQSSGGGQVPQRRSTTSRLHWLDMQQGTTTAIASKSEVLQPPQVHDQSVHSHAASAASSGHSSPVLSFCSASPAMSPARSSGSHTAARPMSPAEALETLTSASRQLRMTKETLSRSASGQSLESLLKDDHGDNHAAPSLPSEAAAATEAAARLVAMGSINVRLLQAQTSLVPLATLQQQRQAASNVTSSAGSSHRSSRIYSASATPVEKHMTSFYSQLPSAGNVAIGDAPIDAQQALPSVVAGTETGLTSAGSQDPVLAKVVSDVCKAQQQLLALHGSMSGKHRSHAVSRSGSHQSLSPFATSASQLAAFDDASTAGVDADDEHAGSHGGVTDDEHVPAALQVLESVARSLDTVTQGISAAGRSTDVPASARHSMMPSAQEASAITSSPHSRPAKSNSLSVSQPNSQRVSAASSPCSISSSQVSQQPSRTMDTLAAVLQDEDNARASIITQPDDAGENPAQVPDWQSDTAPADSAPSQFVSEASDVDAALQRLQSLRQALRSMSTSRRTTGSMQSRTPDTPGGDRSDAAIHPCVLDHENAVAADRARSTESGVASSEGQTPRAPSIAVDAAGGPHTHAGRPGPLDSSSSGHAVQLLPRPAAATERSWAQQLSHKLQQLGSHRSHEGAHEQQSLESLGVHSPATDASSDGATDDEAVHPSKQHTMPVATVHESIADSIAGAADEHMQSSSNRTQQDLASSQQVNQQGQLDRLHSVSTQGHIGHHMHVIDPLAHNVLSSSSPRPTAAGVRHGSSMQHTACTDQAALAPFQPTLLQQMLDESDDYALLMSLSHKLEMLAQRFGGPHGSVSANDCYGG